MMHLLSTPVVVVGVVAAVAVVVAFKVFGKKASGARVARAADLPAGKMREVKLPDGRTVLLVHTKTGKFHALGTKCSHYNASMSKGVLCGDRVVCPWHGACFNVATGDIEDGPVVDGLPSYKCEVRGGDVFVTVPPGEKTRGGRVPRMCSHAASDNRHFVIIGGGPAGLTAAETLRQQGYTGRITVLNKEEAYPYDRTKMSKSMSVTADEVHLRTPQFFEENHIEFVLGSEVESVDTATKTVRSTTGNYVYDKLLVATGGPARTFRPPEGFVIPGADSGNIFTLRTAADAALIEAAAESFGRDGRVAVLGSSFIGMEAAAYLVQGKRARSVTVIGMEDEPFARVLGPRIGAMMRGIHEDHGVRFHLNSTVQEFISGPGGNVTSLRLNNGTVVDADFVIIGAGIIPATQFLQDADGVTVNRDGTVTVDEFLQAAPDVYAAGDIARFPFHYSTHPSSDNIRVEHWDVAMDHGRTAAENMLGKDQPYRKIPFFWTAQYGKSLRYAGNAMQFEDLIVHGTMDAGEKSAFTAYFMNGDVVSAVATFNQDPNAVAAMELFRLQAMPNRATLEATANFDLQALLESRS